MKVTTKIPFLRKDVGILFDFKEKKKQARAGEEPSAVLCVPTSTAGHKHVAH